MRRVPVSLVFFALTAIVFVAQAIPVTGIFLMFMLAPFWSVPLVNIGMIGVAVEAAWGRVSRLWLLLPLAFYGGYAAFAAADRATLADLRTRADAANAAVGVQFDPARQALVVAGDGDGGIGGRLVQGYGVPMVYTRRGDGAGTWSATRLVDAALCAELRDSPTMRAAGIYPSWFHDGDTLSSRRLETRFCTVALAEQPHLPRIEIRTRSDRTRAGSLPVTRVTTVIATPDGRRATLIGGHAAPLTWLPMPVIGCALNSGAPSWDCDAGFWRQGATPIISGDGRFGRETAVLARALGLSPVPPARRRAGDARAIRARLAVIEAEALARQIAAVRRMAADPRAPVVDWDTGVLANRTAELAALADTIVAGLERAAAIDGDDRWKAREGGRILASLVARLPRDRFVGTGPRLLALYARAASGPREPHWLWQSEPLLRRIGELGPAALPVAADARALRHAANAAAVEALCRIGASGRAVSGPVLLRMWRGLEPIDRDARRAVYIALRRIGIDPPPLVESAEDKARREQGNRLFGGVIRRRVSPMEELAKDWGDITPTSPSRVCAPAEDQARREERSGRRRTNLE